MPSDLLAQQHESDHLSQMQCWWEPKLLQTGVVHCKEDWGRQQVQSVEGKRRGGTRAMLWQGTQGIMTSVWVNHQWIGDDKCICWLLVDATRNHGKMKHIHSNQISQQSVPAVSDWGIAGSITLPHVKKYCIDGQDVCSLYFLAT